MREAAATTAEEFIFATPQDTNSRIMRFNEKEKS